MQEYILFEVILSSLAFIFYGLSCIYSPKLVAEFDRYRVPQFRIMIGILEVLGGVGLLIGLRFPLLLIASSIGLTLLMICGITLRIIIRDSLIQMLPAIFLGLLNAHIAWATISLSYPL